MQVVLRKNLFVIVGVWFVGFGCECLSYGEVAFYPYEFACLKVPNACSLVPVGVFEVFARLEFCFVERVEVAFFIESVFGVMISNDLVAFFLFHSSNFFENLVFDFVDTFSDGVAIVGHTLTIEVVCFSFESCDLRRYIPYMARQFTFPILRCLNVSSASRLRRLYCNSCCADRLLNANKDPIHASFFVRQIPAYTGRSASLCRIVARVRVS